MTVARHRTVPDWLLQHRRIWDRKPALRAVYRGWFRRLRAACSKGAPIVEIGCGSGFLRELFPEIIATDAVPTPYALVAGDAAALPFRSAAVANVVCCDVFHHLPNPVQFLHEVSRVLVSGGRLVMLEPWLSVVGRFAYKYLHHEGCDVHVDPAAPWVGSQKHPMEGNQALAYLYFEPQGKFEDLGLPLRLVELEPFAALPGILSGGFQNFNLLPLGCLPAIDAIDRVLSRVPRLTATRCFIVLEKRAT